MWPQVLVTRSLETEAMDREEKLRELRARLDELGREFSRKIRKDGPRAQGGPRAPQPPPVVPGLSAPCGPAEPVRYRRGVPRSQATPPRPSGVPIGPPVRLCEAVKGHEVNPAGRGSALLVRTLVDSLDGAEAIGASFRENLSDCDSGMRQRLRGLCGSSGVCIADIIFMDVESTGLGNSPLFLIGVMVWTERGFEVRQYLARHYGEEAAVITCFLDDLALRRLLVTFNGKSFDLPFIRTRAVATGVPYRADPLHFDLLHESRRIWRATLPDCRLQTLESFVCGRARSGDIPGDRIPEAYHEFVRTDNAIRIVEILKHNMLDLVTLADLMRRLPRP